MGSMAPESKICHKIAGCNPKYNCAFSIVVTYWDDMEKI